MVVKGEFDTGGTEYTITLEELIRRCQSSADRMKKHDVNKLLLLNVAAALRTLGERVEAQDRELSELKNKPLIVGPGGARAN